MNFTYMDNKYQLFIAVSIVLINMLSCGNYFFFQIVENVYIKML